MKKMNITSRPRKLTDMISGYSRNVQKNVIEYYIVRYIEQDSDYDVRVYLTDVKSEKNLTRKGKIQIMGMATQHGLENIPRTKINLFGRDVFLADIKYDNTLCALVETKHSQLGNRYELVPI
jgi:hypothetical protein